MSQRTFSTTALTLALALLAASGDARADGAKPIEGSAPAKPPVAQTPDGATPAAERARPFDPKRFGPVDPAASRIIAAVEEACYASPLSREGMSPEDEAKCNAQVARLMARGAAGVSAILTRLNDDEVGEHYYARTRLYHVLGRQNDQRLRGELVEAMTWIATKEDEVRGSDTTLVAAALEQSFGGAPDPLVPWRDEVVEDHWAEARRDAARWASFAKTYRGKTRGHVVADTMTRARKELASVEPAKAYVAISSLMRHAPREAGRAATAYATREGLDGEQRAAFEGLVAESEWKTSPDYVTLGRL